MVGGVMALTLLYGGFLPVLSRPDPQINAAWTCLHYPTSGRFPHRGLDADAKQPKQLVLSFGCCCYCRHRLSNGAFETAQTSPHRPCPVMQV